MQEMCHGERESLDAEVYIDLSVISIMEASN